MVIANIYPSEREPSSLQLFEQFICKSMTVMSSTQSSILRLGKHCGRRWVCSNNPRIALKWPFWGWVGSVDISHKRCGASIGHGDQVYTWDVTDLLCELRKPPNLSAQNLFLKRRIFLFVQFSPPIVVKRKGWGEGYLLSYI